MLKKLLIKASHLIAIFIISMQLSVVKADDYPIKRLTVGTTMSVNNISIDDYYFGIMRAMLTHRALVQLDEDGSIVADMATSWNTNDAREWRFKLRPGLIWHDNTAVSAHDVKFSMEYLLKKIPVYRWHFKLVESIDAPDEQTVVIRLTEANPRFLVNLLVLRVIPRHIFKDVDNPKRFQDSQAAIGCGPYVFKDFDNAAGTVQFEAFDKYYKGKPNVKEVVFRLFKNPDTLNLAFRKGEVDLPYFYAAGVDPVHARALKNRDTIKISLINNTGVPNVLFFNVKKQPLDNPNFRKALGLAINYEEIIKLFASGYGSVPNQGFIPKGSLGYTSTKPFFYSPEKSRRKLSSLGYIDSNGDGFRDKAGKTLELEIIVRTDTESSIRLAERLKIYFADVGVKLTIKPVDNTLFRQISDRDRSHTILLSRTTPWGMMMWAGCGTGYLDARNIGWSVLDDPGFAGIVNRMNAAIDNEKYVKAVGDLQKYYEEAVPVIPLYWNKTIQPYHKRFSGWIANPMYGYLWEKTWFKLKSAE